MSHHLVWCRFSTPYQMMRHIHELSSILSASMPINKSKAALSAQLMMAFCSVRTVNLKQVVNAIHSKATADSRCRQLQPCFASTNMCLDALAQFIVRVFSVNQLVGA